MKGLCFFLIGLVIGFVLVCLTPNISIIDTDKSTSTNYTYYNKTMYKLVPIDN